MYIYVYMYICIFKSIYIGRQINRLISITQFHWYWYKRQFLIH